MTYNERRALELLPERIASLDAADRGAERGARRPGSLCARPDPVRRDEHGARRGARRIERRPRNNG